MKILELKDVSRETQIKFKNACMYLHKRYGSMFKSPRKFMKEIKVVNIAVIDCFSFMLYRQIRNKLLK